MQTAEFTHSAPLVLSSNEKINIALTAWISADELTPIAFSKAAFFQAPRYGLFVELLDEQAVYTVRKHGKGYAQIIEQDSCFEAIQDIWSIYSSAPIS